MRNRHNKKRNTAFVYEALLREATVATMRGDHRRRAAVIRIMKRHFGADSILRRDLECHQSLYCEQGLDRETSERIIREAKIANRLIDPNGIFVAQSALIADVNKEIEPSVFSNFVPNYRNLASIAQMFSTKVSPKKHVMLEQEILEKMTTQPPTDTIGVPVDDIVVRKFVEKFNEKYNEELLSEQKALLSYYIASFADNALELKVFLNEEVARLKGVLQESLTTEEIKSNPEMVRRTKEVISCLNEFAKAPVEEKTLLTVLRTQSLAREVQANGDNS